MEFVGKRWTDQRILEKIRKSKGVTSLDLFDTAATDDVLREISSRGKLKSLHVSSDCISSRGIREILTKCPIRSCMLSGVPLVDDSIFETFHPKLEIRELYLGGTAISDDGIPSVALLPHLWSLVIDDTSVTDEGIRQIASKQIRLLGFQNCDIEGLGFETWSVSEKMSFYGSGSRLTSAGFKVACKHLINMWNILAENCGIDDEAIFALKGQSPTMMSLNGSRVSRAGVIWLIENTNVQALTIDDGLLSEVEIENLTRNPNRYLRIEVISRDRN